ncbi:MAG: nitroreductase family protein [Bacillota bacterium]
MNETLRVIYRRRSIRAYKPEQISETDLQQIVNAALYAPNSRNSQKWHFTVVQNKDVLGRMAEIIKENMINSGIDFLAAKAKEPGFNVFYNAPTVIMISADENEKFAQVDCGAAAQTIALAAESLNIGSCVMASPGLLFESEKGLELKKELGIPDGYRYVCSVALGYKDCADPPAPPRNKEVINYVS